MIEWSTCTAVERDPERVSGAWVFRGTRVPVAAFFENLEAGASVSDFVRWFPGVTPEQLRAVLTHPGCDSTAEDVPESRPAWLVDHDLERLLRFWRTVPEFAAEWPEWDEDSRLDFIHEWPIERETLQRVVDAAAAGLLNEHQQCKWLELSRLIETHRNTVEQMLGEPI